MKNLIFKSSFHEKLKMLLIAVGLLVTSLTTQVWAYDAHFSLMGDPLDNGWAKDTKYMINTSTGTTDEWYIYVYVAKNQYFALNNGSSQYGPGTNGSTIKNGSGGGQGNYNTNSWKFTGTSGIIKICCAESSNREWYPWVWVEESAPTIKFKHPWNGGSWTEQTATKQSDGTYQYKGKYGGTAGFNAGYSSNFKYNSSATTVTGSPASGDYCYFIWNPVGYVRGTQDYDNGNTQSEHCGTFTIVKLCGLTYDGNGRTGGTAVPTALSDQKYGSSVTLSSAAMTKTGYTLTGWNTANDGSGTHYDLGASFTFSDKANTLYAEWKQDITIDKNGGTSAGSMSICFNAGSLKTFTAATKTDWILDSYWTTADESGSKVIEYDASTGTASLVSSLSGYITTGKWTRTTTTKLYAHWKQTYRVTYYANYPTGATSTGGSVPTDATEYEKNATVTVKSNSGSLSAGGFTFAGWNTQEDGQGTNYTAGSGTFSISEPTNLYAKWTENLTTVTVNINTSGAGTLTVGGSAFTPGNTTTAGVVTSRTVVATPQPGYRYSSWSKSGNATGTNSTNTYTLKGNGSGGTGTLTANFARSYAYIQGRMTIWSTSARSTALHVASSEGGWDVSSTRIQMDYDGTNNRFYRHTYKTPAELSAEQSGNEQYFFFKTSTSSTSLTSAATFRPSSGQTLTAAGVGNKKATTSSSGDNSVWFNSNTSNGYVILYFDQAGVWYELEHTLTYHGNGKTSGNLPASETYYNNGASATVLGNVAATPLAKTNYSFAGWNTAQYITGTDYAAGASVTMNANTTLYAKWTRSVTLNQNGATTNGSTSVTATYNCATLPSISNPSKDGYTFGGWYTANDGSGSQVINTSGALQSGVSNWTTSTRFTRTASGATLYAKWTQTITLNYNSANHGSGSNKSATVILNKTALSSITHCTPATGYHLVGYYTDATGGTKVLKDDGTFAATNVTDYITSGKWTKAGATTLYAHYEPNTYTIHYDPNDAKYVGEATGSMDDQAATWGNYPTLTSNGFTREGYTFAGWATSPTGAVVYSNGQTLSTNLTNDNNATVTLYAKWTGRTYTVTFNARGGSSLSPASKTVTMGATYGTLATVTPPAGYVFDGWYTSAGGGTKVTSATQVTTAVDHTLYAHYIQKAQVYFKNTLGWSQVWVTYDANWDGTQGTGNQGKTYHRMNLVPGTTDVYYDDIPDEYLTSWRWNIAFNNLDYSSTPFYAFDNGEAVYRMDFDKKSTMFVPTSATGATDDGNFKKNNDKVQYRSTGYTGDGGNPKYTSGYWRTYNNTYSGYTMTYQKKNGSWSNGHKMESSSVSDNIFVYTVHMDANSQYNFAFYKERDVNTKSVQFNYRTQITSAACSNLKLVCDPQNAWMQTTVAGDYTFKLEMKNDGHMYLTVVYPFGVGDYRVRYSYTKGSAKTYYSEIIKGRANGKDTISIFIHSADSASYRALKIEKCTAVSAAGVPTWNTNYATITLPAKTAAGQTYDGKTTSGVYNFIISQDGSAAASGTFWKKYDGNYYIRTESSHGGWDLYKYRSDNIMTLSEYSLTQTLSAPFSHYYCRFISEAERSTTDISYAIATDYSPNISGTMVGDATIGGDAVKVLPASANVRFSWNEETNAMRRAYLKNAQTENARFLVLHGSDSKVLDATGSTISAKDDLQANELKFTDMGNWIYQVNLQAQPGAKVSLIANYNSADRYLIGGASSFLTIIDGTGSAKYEMIAVYDFKTNRLMIAWTPSGEVGQNLTDVDVLLVRYKQNAGTLITLGTGKSVTSKTVIGAIRFDYNDLVGHVADWNKNSRPLLKYFISFPFDVNVSDIFGLNSAYGDAYEIQTYDGAERARKGFFRGDGTTTFWRTLQPGEVMKANEGYCVIMDNDYLNNDIGHVWDNKVAGSSVYLYFPSAGSVGSIASSSKTIAIPERTCSIDRPFVSTQAGGRTVSHQNTDSHWNMMGIPIFANTTDGTLGGAFVTSGQDGDGTFKYFYAWNSDNNQFAINTASGYTFNSMHGYMVQYYGNVTFTGAHTNLPTSVARRAPEESHQLELQVLNSDEEVLNRAYVELRENACDTFMLNEDVYMWTTNEAVDVYTFAGNYDVSANVLSLNDQTIPVGVEVRKAGTYIFSMPSNFSGTATLIDTFTGARTNLALSDYEVELEKGVIDDRFLLELSIEKVTTVMETVNGGGVVDTDVRKVLIDGVLYIVKDGKVFDARGARVQ